MTDNGRKNLIASTTAAVLIFGGLLVSAVLAAAAPEKEYGSIFVDEVVSVYDGDTFTVNVRQWPQILGDHIGIRLNGVDTPEMKGSTPEVKAAAEKAKTLVEKMLTKSKFVVLKHIKRDKYFRVVADVECDGKDLGKALIDAGLAKPYDGGTKDQWTNEDVD